MRSFSTACAQLRARDESSKRPFRRFTVFSCIHSHSSTSPPGSLYLSFSVFFLFFFFFKENGIWPRSRKSPDRIYFSALKDWEIYRPRTRVDDTRGCNTRTNIYSSARAEPMVIPNGFLVENGAWYRSHTAGETTCPRSSIHGARVWIARKTWTGFTLIPWIRV